MAGTTAAAATVVAGDESSLTLTPGGLGFRVRFREGWESSHESLSSLAAGSNP